MVALKKKRRRRKTVYRSYLGSEKMKMAFMAGQGMSGQEIALVIGATSAQKVRATLRANGIRMHKREPGDQAVTVILPAKSKKVLSAAADRLDLDDDTFLRDLLVSLAQDEALLRHVYDGEGS